MNRRREGQIIRAWINDEECSWQDGCGKYLTSKMEAMRGNLWYLWKGDVEVTDIIKILVGTTIAGVGRDENRTFESLYYVHPESVLREIIVSGVGHKKYPLLKGHITEVASVSEHDKRLAEIQEFLEGDFD